MSLKNRNVFDPACSDAVNTADTGVLKSGPVNVTATGAPPFTLTENDRVPPTVPATVT